MKNFANIKQAIPAMPIVDVSNLRDSKSLITALRSLEYKYEYVDDSEDDFHEKVIQERKVNILKMLFGAGHASAYMTTNSFELYGRTLDEVLGLKQKAKLLGFKNIQTDRAVWNETEPHSEYVFRIDVNQNESFQIGDPDLQLEVFLKKIAPDLMASIQQHIVYRYSYTTDLIYVIENRQFADIFHSNANTFFTNLNNMAKENLHKVGTVNVDVKHGLAESKLKFKYVFSESNC